MPSGDNFETREAINLQKNELLVDALTALAFSVSLVLHVVPHGAPVDRGRMGAFSGEQVPAPRHIFQPRATCAVSCGQAIQPAEERTPSRRWGPYVKLLFLVG